jgi:hypothetical protein
MQTQLKANVSLFAPICFMQKILHELVYRIAQLRLLSVKIAHGCVFRIVLASKILLLITQHIFVQQDVQLGHGVIPQVKHASKLVLQVILGMLRLIFA